MTPRQFRVTYTSASGKPGACFVDAADEDWAKRFFAQAFPGATLVAIRLEPTNPCAQYERRST